MLLSFVETYKKYVPDCARFLSGFDPIINPRHRVYFIRIIYYCAYLRAVATKGLSNGSSAAHIAKKPKFSKTDGTQGGKYSFGTLFGASVLLFRAIEEQDYSMIAEFKNEYPRELLHEKKRGKPVFRPHKMNASVIKETGLVVSLSDVNVWDTLRMSNLNCDAFYCELLDLWRKGRNRNYQGYLNMVLLNVIKKSGVTIEDMLPFLVQGLLHDKK
jgi:hypothetical protein